MHTRVSVPLLLASLLLALLPPRTLAAYRPFRGRAMVSLTVL